ncbi:hypothetical protein AURDEDRAFT_174456 [Auricularia subglabra TFB-10046 SS5]|uniref:Uncharacterized protein n=1 Tax=Auricularia subglabra (strain TFB-10046 / SS5) TaxID=717982 RepID=J0WT81_AURST|nr:hypothetical protein AURDEDRAFT_174456 [Auricularia subglabra TFB-10046 SS5]
MTGDFTLAVDFLPARKRVPLTPLGTNGGGSRTLPRFSMTPERKPLVLSQSRFTRGSI